MGNTESGNEAPRQGPHTNLFFGLSEEVVDELVNRKRARLAAARRPGFIPRRVREDIDQEPHVSSGQADREEPVTDVYDDKHHRLNESRVDDLMAETMHDAVNTLQTEQDRSDQLRSRHMQTGADTEDVNANIKEAKSSILNKIEKHREQKVKAMEENLRQLQEQEERQANTIKNTMEEFNKNNTSHAAPQEQASVCEKEQMAMTKCYAENKSDLTLCDSYIRAFNDCAMKARLSKFKM